MTVDKEVLERIYKIESDLKEIKNTLKMESRHPEDYLNKNSNNELKKHKLIIEIIKTGIIVINKDEILTNLINLAKNNKITEMDINQAYFELRTKGTSIEDIIKIAENKGISSSEATDIINKLKKIGEIYEPTLGYLRVTDEY